MITREEVKATIEAKMEDMIIQRWVGLFEQMHGRPATSGDEIEQWLESLVREHCQKLS